MRQRHLRQRYLGFGTPLLCSVTLVLYNIFDIILLYSTCSSRVIIVKVSHYGASCADVTVQAHSHDHAYHRGFDG